MPYYRVTYEGYIEGEYENEEEARKAMLEGLDPEYSDNYGRGPADMLSVEVFNEETGEWE